MPTNQQRRATAKRKLERQLERRAKQAKRRRIATIAGASVVAVAVVAAVVYVVFVNKDDHKGTTSASPSSSAPNSPSATGLPPVQLGNALPMPAFKPPANLGANCQYPPSPDKAAKEAKPPRTGKVPTEPAQISASMVTSQGKVGLMLANNESPCTVNSFASLAQQGFFKDTKCHRLTTSPSLSVLQCGDPKGDGTGGPGYQFANEYPTNQYPPNDPKLKEPVIYPRGTLAMANAGPDTNSSQFFMVYRDSALPPEYTVFGTIQADGLATLDKIAEAGVAGGGEDGPPAVDVVIKSLLLARPAPTLAHLRPAACRDCADRLIFARCSTLDAGSAPRAQNRHSNCVAGARFWPGLAWSKPRTSRDKRRRRLRHCARR